MKLRSASNFFFFRLARGLLVLGLAGCAVDEPPHDRDEAAPPSESEREVAAVQQQQQVSAVPPDIVDAKAAGSLCPAGTWSAMRNPGSTNQFRADFRSSRITATTERRLSVKECNLQLSFRSQTPVRFRIARAFNQGGAALEPQHAVRHWVRAYLQGSTPVETSQRLAGPYDGILQIIMPSNSFSQRCSTDHSVNLGTGVALTNDGTGVAEAAMPVVMFELDVVSC